MVVGFSFLNKQFMKQYFLYFIFISIPLGMIAQGNGSLDEFADFSTTYTYEFTTSDGIHLSTDLYLPITSDSLVIDLPYGNINFPIQVIPKGIQLLVYDSLNGHLKPNPYQLPMVFTRTPYSKSEKDALAIIMNMLGYAYALQDMRGRYQSEGIYYPMYSDSWKKDAYHPNQTIAIDFTDINDPHNSIYHQDGKESIFFLQDSLKWNYDLDGDGISETRDKAYNGYLAMFGASAMGNSQYQAAAAYQKNAHHNDLKTIVPIVATLEYFNGVIQQNGVFRQALIKNWLSSQIEDVAVIDPSDNDMQNNIHSTFDFGNLPPQEIIDLAIDQFCSLPDANGYSAMYPNYLLRTDLDASFAPINEIGESDANGTISRFRNIEVPAYHLTGWWDIFIDGQIDTYHKIMAETSETNQQNQKLVIGPWSHGTIGMDSVGDIRYPESVFNVNILYGDISDNTDNIRVDKIVESEVLAWLRNQLNYQEENYLGEPKVLIPESHFWQAYGPNLIRIPAENYYIRFPRFVNFITGHEDLLELPVEMQTPDTLLAFTINIPTDTSIQIPSSNPVNEPATPIVDFKSIKNIRYYVPGPVNDGIESNHSTGNYWYETDDFPLNSGVENQSFYLHASGFINKKLPINEETTLHYTHDPNNPVQTIGGGNLSLYTPVIGKNNSGPIDLANPAYAPLCMNRPDVIHFETDPIEDSLCIMGYAKAKIFVSSKVEGYPFTDTDFFIRILDVYPDGREFFVVEGAVNARARDYAASIANDNTDETAIYTNIESEKIYELFFNMLPTAYTFGAQHKLKVLISSSNYPRYQCNANIPIEEGAFFRREPNDGQTYSFQGQEMSARLAEQSLYFSPERASQLILPIYNNYDQGVDESLGQTPIIDVFPNPTNGILHIHFENTDKYYIIIRNMKSQILFENQVNCKSDLNIDMNHFTSGVYILECQNTNGMKTTKKIIFQAK